jgi:hypothetical protein
MSKLLMIGAFSLAHLSYYGTTGALTFAVIALSLEVLIAK